MYFETIKLVTVKNWKLGLINRILQLLVLVYIGLYAIYLNKGYQKTSPIDGVLYLKVKGLAKDQNSDVYDAGDLVVPPTENNALFITSRALHTVQTENQTCIDPENNNTCARDTDCHAGAMTSNGFVLPQCDNATKRCLVNAWCPVEDERPGVPLIEYQGLPLWTIFMRTHVSYSYFPGASVNNADRTALSYNIFSISDMLKNQNFTAIQQIGAIVNVKIDWTCNLDDGVSLCRPTYQFLRVDTGGSASSGFNYRQTIYFGENFTATNQFFSRRVYSKLYGIRFVFQIIGIGRKFDPATTVVTIGSAAAFFGIATIATDFVLQYLHPKKELFDTAKRQLIDLKEMEEGEPANENTRLV